MYWVSSTSCGREQGSYGDVRLTTIKRLCVLLSGDIPNLAYETQMRKRECDAYCTLYASDRASRQLVTHVDTVNYAL
jgi:hypothetical protein